MPRFAKIDGRYLYCLCLLYRPGLLLLLDEEQQSHGQTNESRTTLKGHVDDAVRRVAVQCVEISIEAVDIVYVKDKLVTKSSHPLHCIPCLYDGLMKTYFML